MPDLPHEIHVELFRNRAELARELLVAHCVSNEVAQVKPVQHRALFRDACDEARLAIVVEVQSTIDEDKRLTWPLYVAAVRERHNCPTYLLVFALEPQVAEWAKTPIELGHPKFCLRPIVISHADVPKMDLESAADSPELRVLRALSHPTVKSAQDAVKALRTLSKDQSTLYLDAIIDALPEPAQKELEASMIEGYVYQSKFARKYFFQGKRDGRKKGLEQGKQDAVIAVAREIIGKISKEEIAIIRNLRDDTALTDLNVRLARAASPSKARAVLAREQKRQQQD